MATTGGSGGVGAGGRSTGGTSGGGTGGGAGMSSGGRSAGGAGTGGSTASGGAGVGGQGAGGSSGGGMSAGGMSAGSSSGGRMTCPAQGGRGGGGAGGGSAGSADTGYAGGNQYPPTFATFKLVMTGTNPACTASDCHNVVSPNPLHMPEDNDDQLLTNLETAVAPDCNCMTVLVPGHPEQSAIVKLLKGPCGKLPQMPNGCKPADGNCVPDDAIAAVAQWIANGASKQ
jgi:hypothetical protein